MGATNAMYAGPWRNSAGISFADWPTEDPRLAGDFSLADLAGAVIVRQNIRAGDAVGGSSMGGMVALEIAKQVPVSAVLLIGSAREPGEIQPFLRLLAPYAGLAPLPLAQLLAGKSGGEAGRMFEAVPAGFIRRSCEALAQWQGVGELSCPVHRLHGECDWVIPCPKSGATVVKGAGHLVGMSEAQVCAAWVAGVQKGRDGPSHHYPQL